MGFGFLILLFFFFLNLFSISSVSPSTLVLDDYLPYNLASIVSNSPILSKIDN